MSKLSKLNVSYPKVWVVIGVGLAGALILAEVHRRRLNAKGNVSEDFGAFVERFELLPFPQPPPPAARLPLSTLTFAVSDNFDVKGYITGYGSADWKRTHEATSKSAEVVKTMLKKGATCVGKTVMGQLGYGILGKNKNYGTPINPEEPSYVPGGSSSGSAVAVAAQIVDFALGTDTVGCIRVPASFCGILGFRPSHGLVSTVGVLPNSQSLDTVGWFASDPSVLHRVGHALLHLNPLEPKRTRRIIIADDLFQLSKVPLQKTVSVVTKAIEKLSGYQTPKHIQFGQYIASNVPSLELFCEESTNKRSAATLRALSSAMIFLQRHEFKINHEEWVKSIKPKLGPDISNSVWAAINTTHENVKSLYNVKAEMRAALRGLLKDDGILIIPTVSDPPLKLNSKKSLLAEFNDRAYTLLGIANMSGGCQVAIPLGKHDDCPVSISLIASHGTDKFLLDTVLDMYSSLQQEVSIASSSSPLPDTNSNMDTAELLKEKGNTAYKGKQWNKAVSYYTEAIKLNDANATYYSNRAAAYLELGCYQQAEEDCSKAISLDKKYVKAYLRRGTAKESLIFYKEALEDFKHALVLEPQNKVAGLAEKRLKKLIG
ncbi:translocon at the outer membrane of chloroplasts 64-V [Perilla frutescens var. hirtella]|uniref:Translocon at the outer membrane of chloroplasts 64-V n=1 Tax=Perilla frutescens var. hirtella TaxID=608512 RepID=A0AAD4P989_PERFH|nr:translocon at the outer membrane of chloroplasts 64-V [Perilla frutescens var. hirtella]